MNPEKLEYPNYLEPIARTKSSHVEVFKDFVRMSVCALSAGTREEDYLAVAGRYNKQELWEISKALGSLTGQMQSQPFDDLLGVYYQDIASKSTRDSRGEFYTPPTISRLMAHIAFNAEAVIERGRPVTINEPTVWSGGMVLEIARQLAPEDTGEPSHVDLMRVTASDISPTACDMSLINFTLWGIPAEVYHQNSLTLETWGHWQNIHWHRVGENQRRAYEQLSRKILNPQPQEKQPDRQPKTDTPESGAEINIPKREGSGGQFEFDL